MGKGPFSWGQWSNTSWSIISKCDGNRHKAGNVFSPCQLVPVKSVTRRIWDTNSDKYQWISTSAKRPSEPTHHQIQGHPRWKSHGMNRMGSTVKRVVPFLPGRSKPKTMVCCRCMWNLAVKRLAESFILYSFPTWHGGFPDPKRSQKPANFDNPRYSCPMLESWGNGLQGLWLLLLRSFLGIPNWHRNWPIFHPKFGDFCREANSRRSSGRHASAGSGRPKYSWKVTSWIRQPGPGCSSGSCQWDMNMILKSCASWRRWNVSNLQNLSNLSFCYKMRLWFAWTNFPQKSPATFLSERHTSVEENPPNMESPKLRDAMTIVKLPSSPLTS